MTPTGSAAGLAHAATKRTPRGHLAADAHRPHAEGDTCLFCDATSTLAHTGEDALAFRDHLARHDHCLREYQMWKQVISDEWLGD